MVISAVDLTVSYGSRRVLAGVGFDVGPGEFFCVLGPNGSGKTTLMKRVSGYLGGGGEVCLGGKPVGGMRRKDLARLLAVVPQRSRLSEGFTLREAVEMGCYAAGPGTDGGRRNSEIVEETIEALGLAALAGRDVGTLSGGEFQRTLLARALVQRPRVLILDEATAHLDVRCALGIFSFVKGLAKERGLSVLAVVHDMNLAAAFADRIMLLDEGKCAGIGAPEDLFRSGIPERVFRVRIKIVTDESGGLHVVPLPEVSERRTAWN